jgi:DNA-binding winged helix-turn-helix (wHTH) protein/tetratricopeptide (TPR) repeat protein
MATPTVGPSFTFGGFRMDVGRYRLFREDQEVPLRPKAWDVLYHLVSRPGLLVTKEAFHREIWPETAVTDDTLTKTIAELRRTLGETRQAPRFIETVHGRGFRFIAPVQQAAATRQAVDEPAPPPSSVRIVEPARRFVGRQAELDRLEECLRRARQGQRQMVFITGEAGIGKTTLAETFLRSMSAAAADVVLLRGQCIQQHGQREPYMPMLEALERLLGSAAGRALIPLFQRVAPCWHVQIPWLLSEGQPAGFQAAMMTAPPERMLREIGAFVESVAARSPVVIVLEDLHWSDSATADLLLFLAERRDPAQLLVIGTFRSAEASAYDHPIREIRQTLQTHRRSVDLPLDYLSPVDVREYLDARFGPDVGDLAGPIHRRTDGNPLFVVAIVEELIRRGQLVRADGGWRTTGAAERLDLAVPEDLLEMVTAQFQALKAEEQSILEAASAIGVTFAPAMVGRVLGRDPEMVDAVARQMVRGRLFLTVVDRSDDRGPATRYEFAHTLHHQVIYEHIPPLRRQRLHLAIGEALESGAGERLAEIAPELSVHFERAGDLRRATRYLTTCVSRAQQRLAPPEAIANAELALDLLGRLPEDDERRRQELEIRMRLGVSLNVRHGYGSPEVRDNYTRARALCRDEGDARQLFEIVHAAWYRHGVAAQFDAAREAVAELARISEGQTAPEFRLRTEMARSRTLHWTGHFEEAAMGIERVLEAAALRPIERDAQTYGVAPMLAAYGHGSHALWFIGRPDRARKWSCDSIAYAEALGDPFTLASATAHASLLALLCGEVERAADLAFRTATVAAENQVANFGPMGRVLVGAVRAAQGDLKAGVAEMRAGIGEHRTLIGPLVTDILIGLLAAALAQGGKWDEGLRHVEDGLALIEATGEHVYGAELWRIKGELLLGKALSAKTGGPTRSLVASAEECFHRAMRMARSQGARSLELRCATSLTRLPSGRAEAENARALLRSLLASFTEGHDTADLREAKRVLDRAPARRPARPADRVGPTDRRGRRVG